MYFIYKFRSTYTRTHMHIYMIVGLYIRSLFILDINDKILYIHRKEKMCISVKSYIYACICVGVRGYVMLMIEYRIKWNGYGSLYLFPSIGSIPTLLSTMCIYYSIWERVYVFACWMCMSVRWNGFGFRTPRVHFMII